MLRLERREDAASARRRIGDGVQRERHVLLPAVEDHAEPRVRGRPDHAPVDPRDGTQGAVGAAEPPVELGVCDRVVSPRIAQQP